MNAELKDKLVIIPKPDYITWGDITELLHIGYAERANAGMQYSATAQSVETTIKRVGDGICLVGLIDGKLVATETYNHIKRKDVKLKKWYHDNNFYLLHSLTVHPDYKKLGIGLKIRNYIRDEAIRNNIDSLISDTSEKATWLIKWYDRLGHKKVGYTSHKATNYYSVVMRTPLRGKKYGETYRKIRLFISYLFCRVLWKENGEFRFLDKIAERIYKRYFK